MRQLEGVWKRLVLILAISLTIFHLLTGIFGSLPCLQQRAVHVGLAISLVFILCPARKTKYRISNVPWWDLLCMILILGSASYIYFNFLRFMPFLASPPNSLELVLAGLTAILMLEASRRTIGWTFPILVSLFVAYTMWGHYIPGRWGHGYVSPVLVLEYLYFSGEGIWGFITGISARYLALFLIFGSFLLTTGGGKTLVDLASFLAGRFRGGPAKVAVFASGFFAMLSGSAIANVATTGAFTIPMMKKLGYKPEFAGGVEAVASCAGQLTPPVMGATAFIMAELVGITYLRVMIAAIIPSFLFYLSTFMGVHFQAVKLNLKPIPREELPSLKNIIKYSKVLCLVLPIATLLYTLLNGYSLALVGSSACLVALVTYLFCEPFWHRIKDKLLSMPNHLESAGKAIVAVVPIIVCANIVVYLIGMTGLAPKFSFLITQLAGGYFLLSLIVTAILVMLLGCSMPMAPAYIITVTVAAPILISWQIAPIAAHYFIIYYAMLAGITPPVCGVIYVASHLAESNWLRTAWTAIKLAPLLYIIPFLLIYDNTFIMIGQPWVILVNVMSAAVGVVVLASGTMGQLVTKCKIYESLVLVAAGVLLLIPGWQTDLLGGFLAVSILAKQLRQWKKEV